VQTRFPPTPAALFKHLPPDSLLRVRCFDGEPVLLGFSTGRLKPKRLLGEITVSASHLQARGGALPFCANPCRNPDAFTTSWKLSGMQM